jgi:pyridoxamine 5'-phosphate oxidase family protein
MFTAGELAYIATLRLGRMATVQPDTTVQVNPVAAYYNDVHHTLDIGGHGMAASRKFRNLATNDSIAIVFDDIASTDPWRVRCIEVRGRGEALIDPPDSAAAMPGPIIRIHPRRVISWGIDPPGTSRGRRDTHGAGR